MGMLMPPRVKKKHRPVRIVVRSPDADRAAMGLMKTVRKGTTTVVPYPYKGRGKAK